MKLTKEFGRRLKARRQYFGWTQQQLGDKVGITKGTIGDLETNRIKKTAYLPQLAYTLEMTINELQGLDSPPLVEQLSSSARHSPVNLPRLANAISQVREAAKQQKLELDDELFSKIAVILYEADKKDLSISSLFELFCPSPKKTHSKQ